MRKIIAILLLLGALFPLYSAPTYALSCVEPPPVEEAYKKYDGVIVARVDEVMRQKEWTEVKLTISKSFKGIEQTNISVVEDLTWGSLWGPSKPGEEYLFFLKKMDAGWENPLCSPTRKVADASKELAFLKDKEIPSAKTTIAANSPDVMPAKLPPSEDLSLTARYPYFWTVIVCIAAVGLVLIWMLHKRSKGGNGA